MLQLSAKLYGVPILSLRLGGQVGVALRPILNPNNLKIEGFYSNDGTSKKELVVPSSEIREFSRKGIIINDTDALTEQDELIRMQKILALKFELLKKTVKTENGATIGVVTDFSFDKDSMLVMSLYVTPKGLRSLTSDERVIGRNFIVRITDKAVIVRADEQAVFIGNAQPSPAAI